jgi:hypothetical protein
MPPRWWTTSKGDRIRLAGKSVEATTRLGGPQ